MEPVLTVVVITDGENPLAGQPEANTWHIIMPETLNEALAVSVFYTPHAVLIDGDTPWLIEAALDLAAMTGPSARGRDVLVRISDAPFPARIPAWMTLIELPSDSTGSEIVQAIRETVLHRDLRIMV